MKGNNHTNTDINKMNKNITNNNIKSNNYVANHKNYNNNINIDNKTMT